MVRVDGGRLFFEHTGTGPQVQPDNGVIAEYIKCGFALDGRLVYENGKNDGFVPGLLQSRHVATVCGPTSNRRLTKTSIKH